VRAPARPCVVFDLGGVLLRPEGPAAELARVLGVEVAALLVPYWRHRDAYDRGGPAADFWSALRRDLLADGRELRDVPDDELDHLDASRWARLADGSARLLADLEGAGTTTAVLSNAPCLARPHRPGSAVEPELLGARLLLRPGPHEARGGRLRGGRAAHRAPPAGAGVLRRPAAERRRGGAAGLAGPPLDRPRAGTGGARAAGALPD
jgi:hypothetical protein